MPADTDRLAREQSFHDRRFADDTPRPADAFYAVAQASADYCESRVAARPPGGQMLDYGCGEGAYAAIQGARHGQRVTAIDLSPVAIEMARSRAEEAGVADAIDFRVMNAEALELPDDEFDFVCGYGVIHHLDISASLREVARVLKPEGAALFSEPMGHNPAINLYRDHTPEQRTPDEHPLLASDLDMFRARFATTHASYFHLAGLLALPLRSTRWFHSVLPQLNRIDDVLMRTPARRWAWMIVLELSGPRV